MSQAQTSPMPSNATSSQPASGFFVDARKGEVNELKNLLKNINVERDAKRKRDIIKKVIACMTLGIDVSRLFTEMIMAIESKDIVVKKMVYHYLCNYAHKEPEMAIMCINSLRRECDNDDPMVRGLALRSLCNLRLDSILEYVEQPLAKALTDLSAYVRKVAVITVLKINYLQPNFLESNGYMAKLHEMLQDVDADVVTNALYVLNELKMSYGGLEISQATIMHLLSRIGEFSEWGLCTVLDIVSRYKPANEDETFAIMNLLDAVLRTANSGAVLGTIKCFMNLTENFKDLRPQIWARAKPPLLTLLAGGNLELQYAILKHLDLILREDAATGVFDDEYRQFFVRYNEPPHIKHLKVALLPLLANGSNVHDICGELNEYVTDVDAELSKCALQAMARIAVRLEPVAEDIVETFMRLVDLDIAYVRSEAFKTAVDVIRVHRTCTKIVLPHISKCLKKIDDADARSIVVWAIGEFCGEIVEAPYLLEGVINDYEEEQSTNMKLHLMTATMKTFFRRAPETQHMLGRLLKVAINDVSDQDVHDRGLLYYRLLNTDVDVATKLFTEESSAAPSPEESDTQAGKRATILQEFNTLAVVFGQPSSNFIEDKYQLHLDRAPLKDDAFEFAPEAGAATSAPEYAGTDIMGSEDLLGGVYGDDNNTDPTLLSSDRASGNSMQLQPNQKVEPAAFQNLWGSLAETFNGQITRIVPTATSQLTTCLVSTNISCIASGQLPDGGSKLFLYASQIDNSSLLSSGEKVQYLAQLIVLGSGDVSAQIKTDSTLPGCANTFADLLGVTLRNL